MSIIRSSNRWTPPNPVTPKLRPTVSAIATELQALQRQRAAVLKSKLMNANRLQAIVAGTLGFDSKMPEKERKKVFANASALIDLVSKGEAESPLKTLILTSLIGIDAFDDMKTAIEKEMVKLAKTLPAAKWVAKHEQRGFGLLFLAIVIGETGDLGNYANPGKVWRRLGCAPWTFEGKTAMGATWRAGKEGKLPASEWEQFGYSPRRRSIAYLIGEGIVKQNQDGPYRKRYDEAKEKCQKLHPDFKPLRCHLHGMLLATKLLLRELWCEWNK